jgi:hypothetical protein
MDPISAVGVAGASVQFAELAVKSVLRTIRFLKDLEEKPCRLKELLSDIDKSVAQIAYLQHALQSTDPSPIQRLAPRQLAALEVSMNDGLQVTVSLQALLRPLFCGQNVQTRTSRLWSAVVSKKMEPEIEEHLQKIQRYNDCIMREL